MSRWMSSAVVIGVLGALTGCGGIGEGGGKTLYDGLEPDLGPQRFDVSATDFETWPVGNDAVWPLTLDRGELWCDVAQAIWFTGDGQHWALNETAWHVAPLLGDPYRASDSILSFGSVLGRDFLTDLSRGGIPEINGLQQLVAAGRGLCGR